MLRWIAKRYKDWRTRRAAHLNPDTLYICTCGHAFDLHTFHVDKVERIVYICDACGEVHRLKRDPAFGFHQVR